MRRAAIATISLCLLLSIHSQAVAQDESLTAAEKAWLDGVVNAGWSRGSSSDDVAISARNTAMMDPLLKTVLGKSKSLSDAQRGALLEGVRIQVKNPGWLKRVEVAPGTYTVGFRQGENNLQTVLRDPDGNVLDVGGMTLSKGAQRKPVTSRYFMDGQIKLEVKWGEVTFSWFYVSAKAHVGALGACTERRAGNVSVFSDLPDEARISEIATLCSKAVAVNETLMGGELPKDYRFNIYLLGTLDAYLDMDKLLTGGAFSRNGAFTSHLTGRNYLWYYPHWGEDYGLPSSWLEVIIHELHHQYVYHALPELMSAPDWFQESCAEVAAQKGLDAVDEAAGHNYRNRRLAELVFSDRAGRMPAPADLLADKGGENITAFYTAAWVIGDALAARADDLHAMIKAMREHQLSWKLEQALLREFDARYPTLREILKDKLEVARKAPSGWIKEGCCVDERDGVTELISEIGDGGFALVNKPVSGNAFVFSGEVRFDDAPAPQVDFVLTYDAGSKAKYYMKIAMLRAKAVLFENNNGEWTTLATLTYDTNLDVAGEKGEPLWHKFKLAYDAETGVVRLDIGNDGRYAKFTLSEYRSARDTYTGVGVYNGVAWFRNLKIG